MSKIRVCFLGTPDFALTSLKALLEDEHYDVVGVVTQPDRPAGRKLQLTPSPVKLLALSRGLKVLSPESLKENQLMVDAIHTWKAEVAVVVAFGQILSEDFMKLFNFGAVNIHGSILPRWRGAAPIQRALEAGDLESGVTLQKIVKKLDAGDILGIRKCDLSEDMNALDLHNKLAKLGAELLKVELMDYLRGNLAGISQDESHVTFARKIDKSEAEISWKSSARQLHNKVRAFVMGPGTFTNFQGKKLKIHKTKIISENTKNKDIGTVVDVRPGSLVIQCGTGHLEILEVQPESRNRMSIDDFLKGQNLKSGVPFQ
ncbi:MAG: methionyl-tRNA formyltransferase [Bdellovibrionota bacterium]